MKNELFEYEIKDDRVTITKYIGTPTDVAIPAEIDGKPVTKIGDAAFKASGALTSVMIPETVTEIGWGAFYGCASLKSVRIPGGVTEIEGSVFYSCRSLKTIIIPQGVTVIGCDAFNDCTSLTAVEIPESVTEIRGSAFCGCTSLKFVEIPGTVTKIGAWAFASCPNLTIYARPGDAAEKYAKNENICLITSSFILQAPNRASFKWNGTGIAKFIGEETEAVIPEGATKIENQAFANCTSLISVWIPESVKEIEGGAFAGCSALKKWNISPTHPFFKSEGTFLLTKDGKELIACPDAAKECRIPEGVTEIGEFVLTGNSTLTTVVIPESVTTIKARAFCGCRSLTTVVIPESVTTIEAEAFFNCDSLTFVVIPESVTRIGMWAFMACPNLTIYAPAGTAAEKHAQKEHLCLTSSSFILKLPNRDSFKWNGTGIAKFLGKETEVVIPEGVTKIGNRAFCGCKSLISVVIPESVTEIGDGAFMDCISLTSAAIPDSVQKIHSNAFSGCTSLKEWPISSTHPLFKSDGTGLLTKDGKALLACLASAEEYQIPEGVTRIESCAFIDCRRLTSVIIPQSVTKIKERTFRGCSALISVTIPDGVTKIDWQAFYGCTSLRSVVIPQGAASIGNKAFDNCPNLTIHAPKGSVAEKYALRNGIKIKFID
ncbi:MAG: leucine-rich repeat domain-containing protein [Thermoguttaceae bacterium]|nr:leucine-rich repeat domain-containing protein [Thermoguttaceae bacterium]